MKKKIVLPVVAISALLAIGAVSTVSAVTVFKSGTAAPVVEESVILDVVKAEKIDIKKVVSGTDNQGHEYKTYSYSITPNDAYYHDVNANISFADSRVDGSSYLTASVDTTNSTFTVTCLQAFDSVATLRLSAAFGNAYCDIQIDYKQKITGTVYNDVTVTHNRSFPLYEDSVSLLVDILGDINTGMTYTKSSTYTVAETAVPQLSYFGTSASTNYSFATCAQSLDLVGCSASSKQNFLSLCRAAFSDINMNDSINSTYGNNFFGKIKAIIDTNETYRWYAVDCLDANDGCWHFKVNLGGEYGYYDNIYGVPTHFDFNNSDYYSFTIRPYTSWNLSATGIESITPESGGITF